MPMRTSCSVLQNRVELTFGKSRWVYLLLSYHRFDICAKSIVGVPETYVAMVWIFLYPLQKTERCYEKLSEGRDRCLGMASSPESIIS